MTLHNFRHKELGSFLIGNDLENKVGALGAKIHVESKGEHYRPGM